MTADGIVQREGRNQQQRSQKESVLAGRGDVRNLGFRLATRIINRHSHSPREARL